MNRLQLPKRLKWLQFLVAASMVVLSLFGCIGETSFTPEQLQLLDTIGLTPEQMLLLDQLDPANPTSEQLALLAQLGITPEQLALLVQLNPTPAQLAVLGQLGLSLGDLFLLEQLEPLDPYNLTQEQAAVLAQIGVTPEALVLLQQAGLLDLLNPNPEQTALLDQLGLVQEDVMLLGQIQNFQPQAPHNPSNPVRFMQVNDDGFSDRQNSYPWSIKWWNGYLYIGTGRSHICVTVATADRAAGTHFYRPSYPDVECAPTPQDLPLQAEIWRYEPITKVWELVFQSPEDIPIPGHPGKFVARDIGFRSMSLFTEFDGTEALYVAGVSSRSFNGDELPPPRILRSVDGVNFDPVPQDPGTFLGDLPLVGPPGIALGRSFRSMTSYKGRLYITASDYTGMGVVLESANPALGNDAFRQVTPPNMMVWEAEVFNDYLYLGLETPNGYAVVKTDASGSLPYLFIPVVTHGGYKPGRVPENVLSMLPFKGSLYVGTNRPTELIRIHPDDTWDLVIGNPRLTPYGLKWPISGLRQYAGNFFNGHFWQMAEHEGRLYMGTWDWSIQLRGFPHLHELTKAENGFDLLVTEDGILWDFITRTGFGDGFNYGARTMASTPFGLFVGAANPYYGAEVWQSIAVVAVGGYVEYYGIPDK